MASLAGIVNSPLFCPTAWTALSHVFLRTIPWSMFMNSMQAPASVVDELPAQPASVMAQAATSARNVVGDSVMVRLRLVE